MCIRDRYRYLYIVQVHTPTNVRHRSITINISVSPQFFTFLCMFKFTVRTLLYTWGFGQLQPQLLAPFRKCNLTVHSHINLYNLVELVAAMTETKMAVELNLGARGWRQNLRMYKSFSMSVHIQALVRTYSYSLGVSRKEICFKTHFQ